MKWDLVADLDKKFSEVQDKMGEFQGKLHGEQVRTIRERSDLKIILKGIEKVAN